MVTTQPSNVVYPVLNDSAVGSSTVTFTSRVAFSACLISRAVHTYRPVSLTLAAWISKVPLANSLISVSFMLLLVTYPLLGESHVNERSLLLKDVWQSRRTLSPSETNTVERSTVTGCETAFSTEQLEKKRLFCRNRMDARGSP